MVTFILFVLILGIVVVAHEFGHFIIAKSNGIHVVEFAVGMGPTLCSFTKGDTKYSLKLLPLGGACMFEGEDGLNMKEENADSSGSFLNANIWARIGTVVAGPVFNFILAFIVAIIMVNLIAIREPVATSVVEGGVAEAAGLLDGDRIVSINGEKICIYEDLLLITATNEGKELNIVYDRNGVKASVTLLPKYDQESGRYLIGISNSDFVDLKGIECLKYAWYEVRYNIKSTYKSLVMLFTGKVKRDQVAGPVGIAVNVVGATYEATKVYGWQTVMVNMMNIILLLSVNLGILNLLPIPALDGGRLVFLLIELVRGKPIDPEKEGMVHLIGLCFFMVLMIFIFFNDLVNIFH